MNTNHPPSWLEAKTKEDLRILMIANNIKHKRRFHYFDFTFAQGKWSCWYELSATEELENRVNANIE